jgi:hypothetical protein
MPSARKGSGRCYPIGTDCGHHVLCCCADIMEQSALSVEDVTQHAPKIAPATIRAITAGQGTSAKRPRHS